ncbi:MAG TPA: ATP-binding protein, partial [Azonexus sp.]|nr:ATP-binding protein [Azonexus sp.]
IVQEALINVAKHAQATAVTVSLTQGTEAITLSISDNGVGLGAADQRQPAAGSGWGLALMAERARTLGGSLHIGPGDGGGTTVVVSIANRHLETA